MQIASEKRLFPFINRVYLRCTGDEGANLSGSALFYRSVSSGGQLELVSSATPVGIDAPPTPTTLLLYLTPSTEGVYVCVDNVTNTTSSNSISLVGEFLNEVTLYACTFRVYYRDDFVNDLYI